jgi:hypothetical protein
MATRVPFARLEHYSRKFGEASHTRVPFAFTFFSKRLLANVGEFGEYNKRQQVWQMQVWRHIFQCLLRGIMRYHLAFLFPVCIYETVCLSVSLFVNSLVYQPVCLSICLSITLSIYPSFCLSIFLSINLSVFKSVSL